VVCDTWDAVDGTEDVVAVHVALGLDLDLVADTQDGLITEVDTLNRTEVMPLTNQ